MLMFIATKVPNTEIIFCPNTPRDYTRQERSDIIRENHNEITGHLGIQRTIKRIQENHTWTHLFEDVEDYVKRCPTCQQEKLTRIRQKEEPIITDTPTNPNEKIAMDIFGPLTKTSKGNQYILSIQDMLTKYLILIPLKNQQSNSIISNLLEHYIYIFSAPKTILTDQGQNFGSKLM